MEDAMTLTKHVKEDVGNWWRIMTPLAVISALCLGLVLILAIVTSLETGFVYICWKIMGTDPRGLTWICWKLLTIMNILAAALFWLIDRSGI
jgi:hypothetical protein